MSHARLLSFTMRGARSRGLHAQHARGRQWTVTAALKDLLFYDAMANIVPPCVLVGDVAHSTVDDSTVAAVDYEWRCCG